MSIRTPYHDLLKADRRALASLFARFRTICKYHIAWLVLRWVTMWEFQVLNSFNFLFLALNLYS